MNCEVKENRSIWIFFLIDGLTVLLVILALFCAINLNAAGTIISIILILALRIYPIFYYYAWIRDINIICDGDGEKTAGILQKILLSALTLGIYNWVWMYGLQNRLNSNAVKYNVVVRETGSTVLLWHIFGVMLLGIGPLMALHIMFQSTNKIAYAYNRSRNSAGQRADQFENRALPENPKWENELPADSSEFPFQNLPQDGQEALKEVEKPSVSSATNNNADAQPAAMGKVQCIQGVAKGQGFRLPAKSKVVIGKNPSKANLVINDSRVSNVHCSIQYNVGNNTYIVTDFSTNGTYINGIRLQKSVPVTCPAGTRIMLVDNSNEILLG